MQHMLLSVCWTREYSCVKKAGKTRLLLVGMFPAAPATAPPDGQDEHPLRASLALASGMHVPVVLQGHVHDAAVKGAQGPGTLHLTGLFSFFGEGQGHLRQPGFLIPAEISGIQTDAGAAGTGPDGGLHIKRSPRSP